MTREPAQPDADLRTALAHGRRDDVVAFMLARTPDERQRLRPLVRRHHDLVTANPTGARAQAGEWRGPLRVQHWSAAAAALLACSSLAQAVRYAPLDQPDAADLPRALFPGDLDAFAAEWSARFARTPKAWDRVRGLDAMFDWAHEGRIAPPMYDGAVLYLVTRSPGAQDGRRLIRYLEARPCLIHTTMAGIFDVRGVKGASPAQADATTPYPERRIDNYVVPELIRRGHWDVGMVLAGVERALDRDLGAYQHPVVQRGAFPGPRARRPVRCCTRPPSRMNGRCPTG